MTFIFNSLSRFSILYFSVLMLDILCLIVSDFAPVRFITKPLLIVLLIIFYLQQNKDLTVQKSWLMTIALSCFLIANTLTLFRFKTMFVLASVFFILAKAFYAFRFANNRDFNLLASLPFIVSYVIYMLIILQLTMPNLGDSLITILMFLFVTLMAFQFAFLRKGDVSHQSYLFVLIGMFLLLLADTSSVLSAFYKRFQYQWIVTMLLYGFSQYLIVVGLIKERDPVSSKAF